MTVCCREAYSSLAILLGGVYGIRQARYFGAAKTAMQLAMAAMVANLGLLAARLAPEHFTRALFAVWAKIIVPLVPSSARIRRLAGQSQMALCRPDL